MRWQIFNNLYEYVCSFFNNIYKNLYTKKNDNIKKIEKPLIYHSQDWDYLVQLHLR